MKATAEFIQLQLQVGYLEHPGVSTIGSQPLDWLTMP